MSRPPYLRSKKDDKKKLIDDDVSGTTSDDDATASSVPSTSSASSAPSTSAQPPPPSSTAPSASSARSSTRSRSRSPLRRGVEVVTGIRNRISSSVERHREEKKVKMEKEEANRKHWEEFNREQEYFMQNLTASRQAIREKNDAERARKKREEPEEDDEQEGPSGSAN